MDWKKRMQGLENEGAQVDGRPFESLRQANIDGVWSFTVVDSDSRDTIVGENLTDLAKTLLPEKDRMICLQRGEHHDVHADTTPFALRINAMCKLLAKRILYEGGRSCGSSRNKKQDDDSARHCD